METTIILLFEDKEPCMFSVLLPLGPMLCLNGATCNQTTGLRNVISRKRQLRSGPCGDRLCLHFYCSLVLICYDTSHQRRIAKDEKSDEKLTVSYLYLELVIIFLLLAHYLDGFRFVCALFRLNSMNKDTPVMSMTMLNIFKLSIPNDISDKTKQMNLILIQSKYQRNWN